MSSSKLPNPPVIEEITTFKVEGKLFENRGKAEDFRSQLHLEQCLYAEFGNHMDAPAVAEWLLKHYTMEPLE